MDQGSAHRADLRLRPYRDFAYPRWTKEPPAGGAWIPSADAFRVEELPLYPFAGDGEHAAVTVEKRDRTTRDLAVAVARRLGVPPAAVGYAGMKDRACVAVQRFTVAGAGTAAAAAAFEAEGCAVLGATRHRNKLRLGHLAGNRFRVFAAGTDPERAARILERLARGGAPNYYGPQRFGGRGDNALQGLGVLDGRVRAGRWKRDLLVSALQSFVFNEVLARRVEAGALCVARPGDVLRREDSGGLFLCEDPAVDGPRVAGFEVSPPGPIWGRKMVAPAAGSAEDETRVLADLGLAPDRFRSQKGTRRPLRVRVADPAVAAAPGGAWLAFACPAGAFATSVVREVLGAD